MSGVTCHVLDTARGRPAAGVRVRLERLDGDDEDAGAWRAVGQGVTDADGRASGLETSGSRVLGRHRLSFETAAYLTGTGQPLFYPRVQVQFIISSPTESYHVPLLLSPFGYSTYRGS